MPTLAQKLLLFGGRTYAQKIQSLFGSSIVSYLPLSEGAGSVAADIGGRGLNGAYTAVTLGQPGIGDGRTSASFDGSTSYVNFYSAALNAAFNGAEGTLLIWAQMGAGGWVDGSDHVFFRLAGTSDSVYLAKTAVNGRLQFVYVAGGVTDTVTLNSNADTGFMQLAITWSKSGEVVNAYKNGVNVGTSATLGVWGDALVSQGAVVGAYLTSVPLSWLGPLAHAIVLNRAATPAEIAAAYAVP